MKLKKYLMIIILIIAIISTYSFINISRADENKVEAIIINTVNNDDDDEEEEINGNVTSILDDEEDNNEVNGNLTSIITDDDINNNEVDNEIDNEVDNEVDNETNGNLTSGIEEIENTIGISAGLDDEEKDVNISYRAHVEKSGWQDKYYSSGEQAGTTGSGLRLEAMELSLVNINKYPEYNDSSIEYSTYVDTLGWNDISKDGEENGSVGKGLRLEAMKINLTGTIANDYDIYYRVHIQNYGWLKWAKNGEMTGVAGKELRMEAFQIYLVEKDEEVDEIKNDTATVILAETPHIYYQTHIQNVGWQEYKNDGVRSGTSGKGLRLEGVRIKVASVYSGDVYYSVHVEKYGDLDEVKNNEFSGTEGEGLRLERIKIHLTGELSEHYNVYYRVHSQNFGDLDWTKNGNYSGTEGYGYRLEGLEVKLTNKIEWYVKKNPIAYHKKYNGIVTISSPTNNQTLSQGAELNSVYNVKGSVNTDCLNQTIKLKIDNKLYKDNIKLDSNKNFNEKIDLSNYSYGKHTISVCAYSEYNDLITSKTITINFTKPIYGGMIKIIYPTDLAVSTIPNENNSKDCYLNVKGWAISSDSKATLRLYIDGKLLISNVSRTSTIKADIDGYTTEKNYTKNQGFVSKINIENYSIGTHTLKIEMVSRFGDVLTSTTNRFQINRSVFSGWVTLDTPADEYIVRRTESKILKIDGWATCSDPKAKLIVSIDGNIITYDCDRYYRADITDKVRFKTEIDATPKAGFKYTFDTSNMSLGRHNVSIKQVDRWGNEIMNVTRNYRVIDEEKYGVDVSKWNSTIDFDALSRAGTTFVIMRVGWYSSSRGVFNIDEQFYRNYDECVKRNIKVGGYVYSYAYNYNEGRKEAEEALKVMAGRKFDLPIFIDSEDPRLKEVDREQLTDACLGFCDLIAANGYMGGVYASSSWFNYRLNTDRLNNYEIWVASYTGDSSNGDKQIFNNYDTLPKLPSYSGRYCIWQYTSSGYIISGAGPFDLNLMIKKYF